MIIVVALTNDDYDESQKEKVWTCDLQEKVVDVKQNLKFIRSTWAKYGCLIVTNGWFVIKTKTLLTWIFQLVWAIFWWTIYASIKLAKTLTIVVNIYGHVSKPFVIWY